MVPECLRRRRTLCVNIKQRTSLNESIQVNTGNDTIIIPEITGGCSLHLPSVSIMKEEFGKLDSPRVSVDDISKNGPKTSDQNERDRKNGSPKTYESKHTMAESEAPKHDNNHEAKPSQSKYKSNASNTPRPQAALPISVKLRLKKGASVAVRLKKQKSKMRVVFPSSPEGKTDPVSKKLCSSKEKLVTSGLVHIWTH